MSSVRDPLEAPFDITPSNTVPLDPIPSHIYVGGTGDVAVKGPGSDTVTTFKNVPVGTVLPVRPRFVMATGTTATLLVGC